MVKKLKEKPKSKITDMNRVTVNLTSHLEEWGEDPITSPGSFSRYLDSKDQVYFRKLTLTKEPFTVDFQWLNDNASYLKIDNREGKNLQILPSEVEKRLIAKRIALLSFVLAPELEPIEIPPGESCFFRLTKGTRIRLRAAEEGVAVWITVYPR